MPRDNTISATKPLFPAYLLPGFKIPFRRRRSSATSASSLSEPGSSRSTHSPASTAHTTPNSSPPGHPDTKLALLSGTPLPLSSPAPQLRHVSRVAPDTLRCLTCSTDLAFSTQIVSKGFTGRHGRAFLVAASPGTDSLLNIRVGRNENRQLVTGWHVVADINCSLCNVKLGWKYVDAKEAAQKYKVGKYILEKERVVTHRHWEDELVQERSDDEDEDVGGERYKEVDDVEFDSGDDDECEDIFAGTWDASEVSRRRRSMVPRSTSDQDDDTDL